MSFGDRVSTEVIVKMKSLGWVLIQCDWFPYRKRAFGHKDTWRRRERAGYVQAKERDLEKPPPKALGRKQPWLHLDCELLASRTVRIQIFVV